MRPSCQNPLWIKVCLKKKRNTSTSIRLMTVVLHEWGSVLGSKCLDESLSNTSQSQSQTGKLHRVDPKKWFHYYTLHKHVVSFASGDVKAQNHIKMRDDRDEMRALRRAWPEIKIIASARGEKEKSLMLKESTFSMVYGLQMMWKERTGFSVFFFFFFWVKLKCARRHCLKILSSFEFNDSEN